jgi:hypothetical protein
VKPVSPEVLRSFSEDLKNIADQLEVRQRPRADHWPGGAAALASRVDLPARQFAAAKVDLQFASVLGEPALAECGQADRPALRASITPAGQMLVPQPRRCVVDNGHMPAPLARNLELEAGRL